MGAGVTAPVEPGGQGIHRLPGGEPAGGAVVAPGVDRAVGLVDGVGEAAAGMKRHVPGTGPLVGGGYSRFVRLQPARLGVEAELGDVVGVGTGHEVVVAARVRLDHVGLLSHLPRLDRISRGAVWTQRQNRDVTCPGVIVNHQQPAPRRVDVEVGRRSRTDRGPGDSSQTVVPVLDGQRDHVGRFQTVQGIQELPVGMPRYVGKAARFFGGPQGSGAPLLQGSPIQVQGMDVDPATAAGHVDDRVRVSSHPRMSQGKDHEAVSEVLFSHLCACGGP